MKKVSAQCNLFLLITLLYSTQGAFFQAGGVVSRALLMLSLLISSYYFVIVNIRYRDSYYIKCLNFFIGIITLYGIINILVGKTIFFNGTQVENYTYLTNNYVGLLPIYTLYFFSRKEIITQEKIKHITFILVAVAIISYIVSYRTGIASNVTEYEQVTNNAGYIVLSLFPLLFFWRSKLLVQYTLLVIIMLLVIFSMKRGAIMIGGILLVWFLYRSFKVFTRKEKVFLILFGIILCYFVITYVVDFFKESDYAQFLIEKTINGNSSGRDILYAKAWNHIVSSNIFTFLFGSGANATYEILGNRAHNDWLEILINQGLLGFIIYMFYWYALFRTWRETKNNELMYSAFGAFILLYALKSLFSMSYDSMQIYSSIILCWSVATADTKKFNN